MILIKIFIDNDNILSNAKYLTKQEIFMADRVQPNGSNTTSTAYYTAAENPNPICVAPKKAAAANPYSEQKIAALKQITQYRQERAKSYERFLNDYPILSDILSAAIPPERHVCKPDQEDSLHYIDSALAYVRAQPVKQAHAEEPSLLAQIGGAILTVALFPLAISGCSSEPEPSNYNYNNDDNDYVDVDKDNDHFCSDPSDYNCDYPENPKDCNDYDGNIYPEADEVLSDGIDQNCNGSGDEDQDGDGITIINGDCHDGDPEKYPGHGCTADANQCDSSNVHEPQCCAVINNKYGYTADCSDHDNDSVVTEYDRCPDLKGEYYSSNGGGDFQTNGCPSNDPCDKDGDGYDSEAHYAWGLVCTGNDCDDKAPNKYPGHGCGSDIPPDNPPTTCNIDTDQDGYKSKSCGGNDCNDTRADINPGVHRSKESCNINEDLNCNGKNLEGCITYKKCGENDTIITYNKYDVALSSWECVGNQPDTMLCIEGRDLIGIRHQQTPFEYKNTAACCDSSIPNENTSCMNFEDEAGNAYGKIIWWGACEGDDNNHGYEIQSCMHGCSESYINDNNQVVHYSARCD